MLQVVIGASFWACMWTAVLANKSSEHLQYSTCHVQIVNGSRKHTHQSVPEVCWLVIDIKAPDVAPMSYPNSSPPIAGNRNTREVMSQSTSLGVMAAAEMSVCGASCNSKKSPFDSHRKR